MTPETGARIIELYTVCGWSGNQIGPAVGLQPARVMKFLKASGVPIRKNTDWTPHRQEGWAKTIRDPEFAPDLNACLDSYCAAVYAACPWGFDLKAARGMMR